MWIYVVFCIPEGKIEVLAGYSFYTSLTLIAVRMCWLIEPQERGMNALNAFSVLCSYAVPSMRDVYNEERVVKELFKLVVLSNPNKAHYVSAQIFD